jgi:hypothetical protein
VFRRIHRYYERIGDLLGLGTIPPKPRGTAAALVIIPVTAISRLTTQALSEGLCLGREVVAVTVVFADSDGHEADALRQQWNAWQPGVPLHVLRTEYASVVKPIVAFIDGERARRDGPIVVLIPVVIPTRARYRLLHNHTEVLLSRALRYRTDLIVARVPMPVDISDGSTAPVVADEAGPTGTGTMTGDA